MGDANPRGACSLMSLHSGESEVSDHLCCLDAGPTQHRAEDLFYVNAVPPVRVKDHRL